MGRGGRRQRRVILAPPAPTPTGVFGLELSGTDPCCGCPCSCCHATGFTVRDEESGAGGMPAGLRGLYTAEEFTRIKKEIDDIFDTTVWPIFPCLFTHFCIPFSPVCAYFYCGSRRMKALASWREKENARLAERGLVWVSTPDRRAMGTMQVPGGGVVGGAPVPMVLTWMPESRPAYEAAHPQERQLLHEGLPPPFWLPEDHTAWSSLLAQNPGMPAEVYTERHRMFCVDVQRKQMLTAGLPVPGFAQAGPGVLMPLAPMQQAQWGQQQPQWMQQGPPPQQTMGAPDAGGMLSPQQQYPQQMQSSTQGATVAAPPAVYEGLPPQQQAMQQQPQPSAPQPQQDGLIVVQPSAFAASDMAFSSYYGGQVEGQAPGGAPSSPGAPGADASPAPGQSAGPQAAAGATPALFCRMCGGKMPADARMCPACGAAA